MNAHRFVRAICVAAAALFAVAATRTIHGAETAPATAHVRFWKTDLRSLAQIRVSLRIGMGKHAAAHDLGSGGPGYQFNNYADTPAGQGTLEVFAGADKNPLLSRSADFLPGTYLTVLLSEPARAGGPPRIEIIDDGSGADGPARAQIMVRSFVTDLKEVRVKVGESLSAQFVTGDSFLQMRGLKPTLYPIRTVGTGLDGKPFEWNNEADLRVHSHQTLLVYPDPYGRIRPRLVVDGESGSEPPTDKEGQR